MNKNTYPDLSESDKKVLSAIEKNYFFGELMLGAEPSIYYEFNKRRLLTDNGLLDLDLRRMELFSGSSINMLKDLI